MSSKPKSVLRPFTARLDEQEYEAALAVAREEKRPLGNLIRIAVATYVADHRSNRGSTAAA
jgi:uncharacterized protein YfaQ (DUF2300 family)